MMEWYIKVLQQYTVFDGRSRRQEYWYFVLFNFIAMVILTVVDTVINSIIGLGFLSFIYSLGVLLPAIGVSIRRLHDINRSGWWLLVGLIPLIGWIIIIIFMAKDSDPGENQFGPNPK